jgi:DNA repair protein RadC
MERTRDTPAWMNVSEVELIYKSKVKAAERPKISQSEDAYKLLLKYWDDNKLDFIEQFQVLLLNRAHKVIGLYEVSSGGVSGTVVDPKLIFTAALKMCACNLIIAHNHPSGSLQPSKADEDITRKLAEAAKLLDMRVLDHLIITRDEYLSFADQGLL